MLNRPKSRFPDNVIVAVLKTSDIPQASKAAETLHPRAVARARGQAMARKWIAWLFGFVELPEINLGVELPTGHKPTKLAFARLLSKAIDAFADHYKFDRSNGYAQVNGKSLAINEAYGFWDELNDIGENFALWDLLEKQGAEPPVSPIYLRATTRRQDGECNFCPSGEHNVYEIASPERTLRVRVCRSCLKSLITQGRQAVK